MTERESLSARQLSCGCIGQPVEDGYKITSGGACWFGWHHVGDFLSSAAELRERRINDEWDRAEADYLEQA